MSPDINAGLNSTRTLNSDGGEWCRPVRDMPEKRPCVVLLVDPAFGSESELARLAEKIGLGCEEEGIPLAWDVAREQDTAHGASLRSRLDVGMLARKVRSQSGAQAVVSVGVAQLPNGSWLDVDILDEREWRWAGQSAARLVKRQHLPPCPSDDRSDFCSAPDITAQEHAKPVEAQYPPADAGLISVKASYTEGLTQELSQQRERERQELDDLAASIARQILASLKAGN